MLAHLAIVKDMWGNDAARGHIRNICFSGISLTAKEPPRPLAELEGFDADHKVEGVTFENIQVNGQRITQQDPALFKANPYTGSITVK